MDIEFVDPEDVPLEPEDVRLRDTHHQVLADGRRLSLTIETSPFTQPPDLDIVAYASDGREVGSTAIIGAPNNKMSLTFHLKGSLEDGSCTLKFSLRYPDIGVVDEKEEIVRIPEPGPSE